MPARRGVFLFLILMGVFGLAVLSAVLVMRFSSHAPSGRTVLTYDVPSQIDESEPPFVPFSFRSWRRENPTLYDVVSGLRYAATDDHVEALVLHVDRLDWGWSRIAELRDAVRAFRETGKPVYASLGSGASEPEYLLASVADEVCMAPTTTLGINGLSLSVLFLRGTLDKAGITPNFDHVGTYKSAIEQYTRNDMSPPAREALDAVLDDYRRLLVDSLASARGWSVAQTSRLVDGGPYTASEAVERGLLDTLVYGRDVDSLAILRVGGRAHSLPLGRYLDRVPETLSLDKVALVVVEGEIVSGRSGEGWMGGREVGSETLVEALREARRRHSIKAIVLRVDSPGGSADAADDIWHEVELCRRVKPVVVSMGDYAASGGYYISAPADTIVAEPATLTGSIGIFAGKFNLLGGYRKLGMNIETLSRGPNAELYSPFKDFSADEARRFHELLERGYHEFVQRVARGRKRPERWVEGVAQGRVWTGSQARARGLVDVLGGMDTAIQLARRRAGIGPDEEVAIERLPRVRYKFLQGFLEGLVGNDEDAMRARLLAELPPGVRTLLAAARFRPGERVALMPFRIEIR